MNLKCPFFLTGVGFGLKVHVYCDQTFLSYLLFTESSIIVRWSSLEGEDFAFAMHRGFTPFLGTVKATERIQRSGDA